MVNYIPDDNVYVPRHVRMAALDANLSPPHRIIHRRRVSNRPPFVGRNLLRISLSRAITGLERLISEEDEMDINQIEETLLLAHENLQTIENLLIQNQVVNGRIRRQNAQNPITIDLTDSN